uniref:D(2) dopamine receptor A-like n=1 Tax=Saccoglossus kowalevskii TaxID=10224 RepID=A0ABM0GNS1_SACKO|nr:PREDICTED: D(2) dopamine receptor A-like [Saccoglossus kowalevskii]
MILIAEMQWGENISKHILYLAVLAFISVPVVFGNMLVILAVYQNHSLRTIPNYFLVSLAFADLMIGCTSTPLCALIYGIGLVTNKWACIVVCILASNPLGVSLMHLLVIGIDRYIAILHPLHYHQWVTVPRVKIAIAILWTYSVLTLVPFFLLNDNPAKSCHERIIPLIRGSGMYISLISFAVQFIIMVTMYVRIFSTARHHLRRIYPNSEETQQQLSIKKEIKAAIMPCIVLGVLFICWVPHIVASCLTKYELCLTPSRFVAYVFILINSGSNPFIYARHNTEFRQAYRKIFLKMKAKLCK